MKTLNINPSTNSVVDDMNDLFNEFLKVNVTKINCITPKDPIIYKDDEWVNEIFWDKKN